MTNWRQRTGSNDYIINKSVDEYLKTHDFYVDTMSPRFFGDGTSYGDIIKPDAPCLRLDADHPDDNWGVMRIFINAREAYIEYQNGYRSLDKSWHEIIERDAEDLDISQIDEILDDLTDY